MNVYPKYWLGAYNRQLGLAVMRQMFSDCSSQMVVAIMLPESEAIALGKIVCEHLRSLPAAPESTKDK